MTGIEPLALAAVSGVAVPIFQTMWGQGSKFFGMVSKKLDEKTRQIINTASGKYVENYSKRHGILKVLGMREPVPLESVYTAVQFLNEQDLQRYDSVEGLETAYREAQKRSFQKDCPRQEGLKVANEKQYLMILGSPGAGKSTFLRKMGLEALRGKRGGFRHQCIPVFIELKRFDISKGIKDYIVEEFNTCGFPSAQEFTDKALEQGKLLILLDGLDEVPTDNMSAAIRQIQDFVDQHNKNRFIASCRVAAYRHNFKSFTDVAMADFDDVQIQQFINNWFGDQTETGKDCWKKLNSGENAAAKELTQTPLLLTLVCLVYQDSRQFPSNRATLYEKALSVLLEEWAEEKELAQEPIYKGLDTKQKERLLSQIAYQAFQSNRLFLPRREVSNQIEELLKEILPEEKLTNGADVLRTIEVQHGILVERAKGIYSFSHLTLQEYLTAQYIDDHHQIKKLVVEHLTDERWREVFLLVAGLMRGGADELLLSMEKVAQKYINTPKLKALLLWAEQITAGSQGDFKPVGKRAIAYAYANANVYANVYANAYVSTNVYAYANANVYAYLYPYAYANTNTHAYAESIDYFSHLEQLKVFKDVDFKTLISRLEVLKAKVPDDRQPREIRKKFGDRFFQTCLQAFKLTPEMVNLSQQEIRAWDNYFYANWLIIQCKQAAVWVSPQTWAAIEDRMLLPPQD
jgi:hypothetical protein